MENFLFPVIKVKVIKVIKGFGGNGQVLNRSAKN